MITRTIALVSAIAALLAPMAARATDDLADRFSSARPSARPWVYWWWLNSYTTKEGITRDLEEMKRQGITGVLIFDAGGPAGPMPQGKPFLSPEWRDHYRWAIREATRLKMEVSANLCDGWDAGGSWITPDCANKKLTWSERQVDGPGPASVLLPMPPTLDGYYRDVAVVAIRERSTQPLRPASVQASSSLSGYCGEWNYPPDDAADSDPDTYWDAGVAASRQAPVVLDLEYHDAVTAAGLYLSVPADGPSLAGEVQAQTEGEAWRSVAPFSVARGKALLLTVPPTSARRFRLAITSSDAATVRLAEASLLRQGDEPAVRRGIRWWWLKSGNRSFWDWPPQGPAVLSDEYTDWLPEPDCHSAEVVDLSANMGADGRLTWQAPPGRWTVLRFGYTLQGQRTRCGSTTGYEADMLSAKGIESHFEHCALPLIQEARAAGGRLANLHVDSYELGADVRGQQPNWSATFRAEFRRRRGYDLVRYLPAMARRVVDSREVTDRFLWDVRATIGDLFADGFFKRFAELAHAEGVGAQAETGYGTYPHPHFDGLRVAGLTDAPMGEFWHGTDIMSQFDPFCNVIRTVATAAHVYGKQIVQAESFTSWDHFVEYPAALKALGDQAFCDGLNRIVFHQYTHQPRLDTKPGWQYGAGTHIDRNLTWWPMADAWFRYLTRCQTLLQAGRFHADVCYLYGEGATRYVPGKEHLRPALPAGYNYDFVNADAVLHRLSVRNGRLVLPTGVSYRLLVLPEERVLSPGLLRRIGQLIAEGAAVLGSPPISSPGLTGYPGSDADVRQLAAVMWGTCDGRGVRERKLGRGRILCGMGVGEALRRLAVSPDCEFAYRSVARAGLRGAAWIWHAADGDNPPECARLFRSTLTVPNGRRIVGASVSIVADNAFELSINGRAVCRGDNFHQVVDADIAPALRPGLNQIQVRAENTAPGPAGLICRLEVTLEGGAYVALATGDPGWQSSADGGAWASARSVGVYGSAPWGAVDGADHGGPAFRFIHRVIGDADTYFVANQTDRRITATCTFRAGRRVPELWDPITGERRDLAGVALPGGRAAVPMRFEPAQSYFVIFRRQDGPRRRAPNFPEPREIGQLRGPWEVAFDRKWGGPATTRFAELDDWAKRPEDGIRHYSGIATYRRTFDLPAHRAGGRLWLDLGEVRNIARVRLNGHDLGVVWTAPWRVDITSTVRPKGNRLEIEVANLWPNRLIGDAALPPGKRYTSTNVGVYGPQSQLLSSGLLGPATLLAERKQRGSSSRSSN